MNRFSKLLTYLSKTTNILVCLLFLYNNASAQAPVDTTQQGKYIQILNSEYSDYIKENGQSINKIVGSVKLLNGSDTLYCDSAILYQDSKIAEAFGNVSIFQADGSQAFADYMKYNAATKLVSMIGEVILIDNRNNELWSEEVTYNLATKIGNYYKNGTLVSDGTLLSSQVGEYNMNTHNARFKKDVVVNDPEYTVTSEDLGYNTQTRIVTFFAPAVVQNGTSILTPNSGTYNAGTKQANFTNRAGIIHNGQFIDADIMKYDQTTGIGIAIGNVVAIDTAQKMTIYGGYAQYNEQKGDLMVVDKPIIKRSGQNDTLYILQDTVLSGFVSNLKLIHQDAIDSAQIKQNELIDQLSNNEVLVDSATFNKIENRKDSTIIKKETLINKKSNHFDDIKLDKSAPIVDSALITNDSLNFIDTTAMAQQDSIINQNSKGRPKKVITESITKNPLPINQQQETQGKRYFFSFHNVRIFSDSMQAHCDSLRYAQSDSLMIMYKNPIVWSTTRQITGDTIYAKLDSNKLEEIYIPKNATIVSQSGPESARLFDQVQGNRIHAYFVNNDLDSMVAYPNAATIYYIMDSDSAYVGASEITSNKLRIQFVDRKIQTIYYLQDVKQKLTPMEQVVPEELRLSRFSWRINEKSKDLQDFLKDATPFQKYKILGIKVADQDSKQNTTTNNTKKKKSKKK